MEKYDRGRHASELPPEKVIVWLRSQTGEQWSQGRAGELERHRKDSGVFADVFADGEGFLVKSRWPVPHYGHDLDR